ncbi:MAG: GIY-YIG nuclease family protein [Bacteroidota bacterium]
MLLPILNNTTLYTGVCEDLVARTIQHIEKAYPKSFTARYNCSKLVYYELFHSIEEAINRAKQIKAGSRNMKIGLIEAMNPEWKDLFEDDVKNW